MTLCTWLRWKGFYGASWQDPAMVEGLVASNPDPCWCLKTSEAWGPDERPAEAGACAAGRRCFEARRTS